MRATGLILLVILLLGAMVSLAQSDPTPTPLVNIPTATPAAQIDAIQLDTYGLQPGDLPNTFVYGEGEFINAESFPQHFLDHEALLALYDTYGVAGIYEARHTTETCDDQVIVEVATVFLPVSSAINAQLFVADETVIAVYEDLFGWMLIDEEARSYSTESDLCDGTTYVLEYAIESLIVQIQTTAPDSTDPELVEVLTTEIANIINARILGEMSLPVTTFDREVNIRRGASTAFNPPLGLARPGDEYTILAVHSSGNWLKIAYEEGEGWVFAELTNIDGDISDLPREAGPELVISPNSSSSSAPLSPAQPIGDADQDGILDNADNCAYCYNPGQEDNDGNGIGNVCELSTCSLNAAPPPTQSCPAEGCPTPIQTPPGVEPTACPPFVCGGTLPPIIPTTSP